MTNKKSARIETKSSRTAEMTCLSRATSYMDKRECYAGPDGIAYVLVPLLFKLFLKPGWLFKLFSRYFFPDGIYEYVIARTKYFDAAFTEALEQGFDQIVIFGAGFDSRALRFNRLNRGTRIFELDAPITQNDKLKAYQEKKLAIPENLVFVPIDFNKEEVADKMARAGFAAGRKSLLLLEGVTMYLSREAVESTFRFIEGVAGRGSLIVFDYIYAGVLRKENKYYGEGEIYKTVAKVGEEWTFALEESEIQRFIGRYGFSLKDHSDAQKLEDRYFRNSKGLIVGKINGTHAIVTGVKK
ncbi:MAG: SAM-dependent methyltransferase [Dehalococcoidia bacterium]|nr:SAM-dependent methyltransferase [Dehalococcoidia bacterium]